jgi:hypothetical protein
MRNLSIVITIGAILAVTTAGYYGSDMLIGDEDNSLVSTDENNSGTEQASEQDNVLSENREIKGRDNKDAETEEASADTTSKDGIIMSSNLVAGENTRLVIYDEGNRVTGETVYLDGEEIGETSQTGALTFEVPNKEEIRISTDSGLEKIITSVEGYDEISGLEVNFISPSADQIEAYKDEVVVGFESNDVVNYSLVVDGGVKYRGSLDAGNNDRFSQEVAFEQGQHRMYVNWSVGQETWQTEVIEFETMEERPLAELSLTTPDEGYLLTAYEERRWDTILLTMKAENYRYCLTILFYKRIS